MIQLNPSNFSSVMQISGVPSWFQINRDYRISGVDPLTGHALRCPVITAEKDDVVPSVGLANSPLVRNRSQAFCMKLSTKVRLGFWLMKRFVHYFFLVFFSSGIVTPGGQVTCWSLVGPD